MTLIATDEFKRHDPILDVIASLNNNAPGCIEHRVGIYEVGHFGSSGTLRDFEHYPDFDALGEHEYRGSYGVCDDVENLLAVYPELEAPGREFVVRLTPVLKVNQGSSGGWRWHRWGEYIGHQNPSGCEYLHDEPAIEKVYCFWIYERRLPDMTATEGRIKPQSISGDVALVVAELRQALRPIESPYGESSGGPDGWSPEPDEIAEWEMTFQEHATPANVSTLLAALTLVQTERDAALVDAESWRQQADSRTADAVRFGAERDAMQQERDELRAALRSTTAMLSACRLIVGDAELRAEMTERVKANAALTPKATQQETRA